MNSNIINHIYKITANLKDPLTNEIWYKNTNKFNILIKDGSVNITINIDLNDREKYEQLELELKNSISKIDNVSSVNIVLTSEKNIKEKNFKINSKKIIAIASGKGGVGKSTFAVNLAVALSKIGNKVGILDADIYGPSVPRMMGISDKPKTNDTNKLIPLENYGIKCMSIGFLIDVDTPAIWRGPMVMKALEQMFNGVDWGELDFLIIDLPPGTGDAQLSLAQNSKLSGSIIISTPQDVALIDVRKGINMFRKVDVPILGIVENMSYFICKNCNEKHEIFSSGGVRKESEKNNIPFLGELPIDINLRQLSDEGKPSCVSDINSEISKIYISIAKNI
tara:strand:+ start:1331 stop:2341 length:1011 start_codon:yes stop_codon:yes gene_type:complete